MKENQGLYRQQFEHDNCGIGAVINSKGIKSHTTVENALKIVENLEHRAGKDAEGKTGDGVGILLQISHKFFKKECDKLGIQLRTIKLLSVNRDRCSYEGKQITSIWPESA